MVRRLIDVGLSAAALVLLSPLLAVAALGVRLAGPGPVLFRAKRVGLRGRTFTMYKFRTMRDAHTPSASVITALHDARVFAFGRWLRSTKIDELPQLINILRGEMSVVGPRPEDPKIVDTYYGPRHFATLAVRPGLASPGSIYNYTHGEALLGGADTEEVYAERLMPIKLALDLVYVREASWRYDVKIMLRAAQAILLTSLGRRQLPPPPEMTKARELIQPARRPTRHAFAAVGHQGGAGVSG